MTPRPNALRIGLFALLGVALLATAMVSVVGLQLFKTSERVVMHFSGTVYGLQVGAPVVFRGVRLGTVRSVSVSQQNGRFAVPVVAELESEKLRVLAGEALAPALSPLAALLGQGLSAQLATQSLLTGQLYVDLDFRPVAKVAAGSASARAMPAAEPAAQAAPIATHVPAVASPSAGLMEIPTSLTRFQSLQDQLDRVDLNRMSSDLQAALSATRQLVAGSELQRALAELTQAASGLARVSATLNQRLPPLVERAGQTLQRTGAAAEQLGAAAERVGAGVATAGERVGLASDRVSNAASQAGAAVALGSPLLGSVQGAADELKRTAAALREAISEQGATAQELQRALADLSRAARAARALAEQIEQQPQSLIRGREVPP
jgi:paraquat-inducible protein B